MQTNERTAEVLNDLVQINHDRVEGYQRASKETNSSDADLRSVFQDLASTSERFANELSRHVAASGEEPAKDTTIRGKIYRAWMDVKATFTGSDRKAILASCEYGEDAAQRAYERALDEDDVSPDIRQLITEQKTELRRGHDLIKRMRDSQPT